MYRRSILCTLYGTVDFLNVLKKYIMSLQVMVICDIMSLSMMARCARDNLRGQKSLGPLKCPSKWLIKLLSHKKKIGSRSFLNSGTLIVNMYYLSPIYFSNQQGATHWSNSSLVSLSIILFEDKHFQTEKRNYTPVKYSNLSIQFSISRLTWVPIWVYPLTKPTSQRTSDQQNLLADGPPLKRI